MNIYFKNPVLTSVEDFLFDFFIEKESPVTYYDESCTDIQCDKRRSRSFRDIKLLVKTYFDQPYEERIAHFLVENCQKQLLGTIPCNTAGDIVFRKTKIFNYPNCIDHAALQKKETYCTHSYGELKELANKYKKTLTNEAIH